jgi:hypothetical protein
MKKIVVIAFILLSTQTFAESYVTYTDIFAKQTVSLTISQNVIQDEEVVLNGRSEYGTTIKGKTDGALKITSPFNNIIINIPSTVKRSKWTHQVPDFFTDGDTRILTGDMTINDRPVQKLIEIYAGE